MAPYPFRTKHSFIQHESNVRDWPCHPSALILFPSHQHHIKILLLSLIYMSKIYIYNSGARPVMEAESAVGARKEDC